MRRNRATDAHHHADAVTFAFFPPRNCCKIAIALIAGAEALSRVNEMQSP